MRNEARRGFMLLEAMVALLVIGVMSAAALELFAAHARSAARVPPLVVATELAREQVTAIRLLRLDRSTPLPDSLAHGTFAPPFSAYRWRASLGYSTDVALQDIHVEVEWPDGRYALDTRESVSATTTMRGSAR